MLGLIKLACKGKWRPSVAAAKSSGHSESLAIVSRLGAPPMVSLRSGRGYHYAMPNAKTAYAYNPPVSRVYRDIGHTSPDHRSPWAGISGLATMRDDDPGWGRALGGVFSA
jgi:hypothetical protein